jgi:hypothetical protein
MAGYELPAAGVTHEGHVDVGAVEAVELVFFGAVLVEGPSTCRYRCQHAWADDGGDELVRRRGHPRVDLLRCFLRLQCNTTHVLTLACIDPCIYNGHGLYAYGR